MTRKVLTKTFEAGRSERSDSPRPEVELSRRAFVQVLGTGLLITVTEGISFGQRRGGRGGSRGAQNVAARLHINQDGTITVMTGKVEEGQGSRGPADPGGGGGAARGRREDPPGDGRYGAGAR